MTKNMLFVKPPIWELGEEPCLTTVPYGILSIVTYINKFKSMDIQFDILDMNTAPWSDYSFDDLCIEFTKYIDKNDFNIIGLSIMYNHMYPYIEILSDLIKDVNNNIVTLVGGACATVYYEKMLVEIPTVDVVCYAEGELPIFDLLHSKNVNECFLSHPSFITKESVINKKIPLPNYIEDLDLIPPINFSLIDLSKYLNKFLSVIRPVESNKDEFCLPITTTRGCPYSCVFCTAGTLSGKKVRKASAEKVINDIIEMRDKYGVNTITIEDDQFLYDKKRAKKILSKIAELKIILFSNSGFTVSLIDDEIVELMKNSGLRMINLPIESGSPHVAYKIIHKPIRLEKVAPLVIKLRKAGIYCSGTIIIGLPGEKPEHRQESIDFVKKSGIDWCYIFCAKALKGSKLYDDCIKNKYIDQDKLINGSYYSSQINTPDFTSEEITEKSYLMNLELNFVENNNIKRGEYKLAIIYFEHVLEKCSNHAFAMFYIAKCYGFLKDTNKFESYMDKFYSIILKDLTWKKYSNYFGLV